MLPLRRPTVNMTDAERGVRVALGAAGGGLAVVFLALPASGAAAIVLWLLIVVTAIDLLVSGAVGHCPLYRHLDVPWAPRGAR